MSLELKMGYYHISLSEYASNMCTIIIPWGKYSKKYLPMAVSNSPDIFQEIMNKFSVDLNFQSVHR